MGRRDGQAGALLDMAVADREVVICLEVRFACVSPECQKATFAGLVTAPSPPPWTCRATWSPRPADGPATRSATRLASAREVPQPTNAKGSVCCPGDRQAAGLQQENQLFQEAPKTCLVRINAQEGDHGDASCRYRCYRGR